MTNNKLFLLIGTSLSLVSQLSFAQCIVTQDCATLGYTEMSCSGGSGVKCPFGNKWACFKSESEIKQEVEQEFCNEYGFTQTCTASGQIGGASKACNGKYYECSCASGYEWDTTSKSCKIKRTVCVVGTLYYSDNTCSADYTTSKTLLGVVVYSNPTGGGWVMTVKPIQSNIKWSTEKVHVPGIISTSNRDIVNKDVDSCGNTDKIRAYGNSSKYPAAWAAYDYQPVGTPTGKHWCLPASGVIKSIYSNILTINTAIGNAGGTKLNNETIWSSSEYSAYGAWVLSTRHLDGLAFSDKDYSNVVRPVLAF